MKRRTFIKKAGLTASATISMPYILPSGRLFARTGQAMASHVVLVIFGGGVRHQEAIGQRYLTSQNLEIEGNIMYNMLTGEAPDIKIVYGTDTADGQPGGNPINAVLNTTLQEQGTLFPEVRYSAGGTGHFGGLSTAVSGYYGLSQQGLQQRPLHPTIFEYLRRFGGYRATDTWFIGNGIGNSTPLLNHSIYQGFGADYGGNFFAPNVTFGQQGEDYLLGAKIFHPEEELDPIRQMQAFLNHNFLAEGKEIPNLKNTDEEKQSIKEFIKEVFERQATDQIARPPVMDNGDLSTISYATEVLRWFKPKLTVINMSAVDSCHASFTGYLQSLHRGDHAIGFLWKYIQTQIPEMAGNTTLLVMPEHGRNLDPNGILDENDWLSFDHDSDPNSRRIFTMMAGPNVPSNLVVGSENNPVGDAADIALTIADILGVKNEVINTGLMSGSARSLFDRI